MRKGAVGGKGNRETTTFFRQKKLKEADLKRSIFLGKMMEKNLFPGIQKPFVFLLTADGKIDPKLFPGIKKLGNHMGNLNEQIMVLQRLPIPAEKMFKEKAVILLGIKAIILNGPSSSAIGQ